MGVAGVDDSAFVCGGEVFSECRDVIREFAVGGVPALSRPGQGHDWILRQQFQINRSNRSRNDGHALTVTKPVPNASKIFISPKTPPQGPGRADAAR